MIKIILIAFTLAPTPTVLEFGSMGACMEVQKSFIRQAKTVPKLTPRQIYYRGRQDNKTPYFISCRDYRDPDSIAVYQRVET